MPRYLRERCAARPDHSAASDTWSLSGSLLFVDLVGFTAQVERWVADSPEGVERANSMLNDTIGSLVAQLTGGGGDVVVFAGDALFVLWPMDEADDGAAEAVLRAAGCALEALARQRRTGAGPPAHMRFALGAGHFAAHRVGGLDNRWHGLLSGPAFEQVGRVDALARNDVLLISDEAAQLAGDALEFAAAADGAREVLRLHRRPHAPAAAGATPAGCDPRDLARYLSAALDAGARLESRWLAEFRHVAAIFARLPGLLDHGTLDGSRAQDAVRQVQTIVDELGGTILQFVVDDKGPVFVIAFGLAARVHEDDPARAAIAALRLAQTMTARDITCGVGVATGRVFCGLIGSEQRCSYTLIGRTMNLAARLMQRAQSGPLFDQATQDQARRRVHFVHAGMLHVKGFDPPVAHYRATGVRNDLGSEVERGGHAPLIGRGRELDILLGELARLRGELRGGLVVLVGEAGIGKSRLVRELIARAGTSQVGAYVAAGGSIDAGPYARWRPTLQALLAGALPAAVADDPFLQAFMGHPQDARPEAEDAERAFRTREALARVVLETARAQPLLLCVEDTHWMDSLSWSLVVRLAQATADPATPLLLLLTTRELEANAPADALARLIRAGMLRVPLGPLAIADRSRVAQAALQVGELPPPFAAWIARRSGGNPLFCRELATAAVDSGRVHIADGRARLDAARWSPQDDESLPLTLQGLIASRLDRLEPATQQMLRVAAVIGARFSVEALQALSEPGVADLYALLERLRGKGLLEQDAEDSVGHYAFQHALVRDAAYDSLPYRRRRELHSRLARWLEQRFADDLAPHTATLAFHWERAEVWDTAYQARLRAGEAALQSYSNREALEHFAAAARLRPRVPAPRSERLVHGPELGMARALHRMGDERAARAHIEDALRDSGEVLPRSTFARVMSIAQELLRRVLPAPSGPSGDPLKARTLRAKVAAYDLLPEILYYDNDPVALAHVSLRFLRLAEAEGIASAEHARARGWFALLQSGLGWRSAVDRSFDISLRLAMQADDPSVDAWLRLARGSTLAQFGEWDQAERWLRDARGRCEALGDRTRWWNVTSGLGHVLSFRGELAAGAEVLAEALRLNCDTDNPVFLCWGLSGHADILHRIGKAARRGEVVRMLRDARQALTERPDAAADLFSRGLLAAALWRDAQPDEAFELARDTVEHALERAPMVWLQVGSYLGLIEVLAEAGADPARREEALRLLLRLARSIRSFARLIPVGRAALHLARGQVELLRGGPARAPLLRGLEHALRHRQPLEAARLEWALAAADPARAAAYRQSARTRFERIGAGVAP